MWKLVKKARWIVGGAAAYALAFGGCISNAQGTDFLGTEVARITGNLIGELFLLFVQSINPLSA